MSDELEGKRRNGRGGVAAVHSSFIIHHSAFAVLIAFLFGLPHLLIPPQLHGRPYCPLVVDHASPLTKDETSYAKYVQRAAQGHWCPGDTQAREYQQDPAVLPPLPFALLGLVARLIGVPRALILADFVLPPLLGLLVWLLAWRLTRGPIAATLAAVLVLVWAEFPVHLIHGLTHPRQLPWSVLQFIWSRDGGGRFLQFSRFPHPQFSGVVLFAAILALERLVHGEVRSQKSEVRSQNDGRTGRSIHHSSADRGDPHIIHHSVFLAGAAVAANWYTDVFTATLVVAGAAGLLAMAALGRRWQVCGALLAAGAVALVLAAPALVHLGQVHASGLLARFGQRMMFEGETFGVEKKVLLFLAAAVILAWRRRELWFVLAFWLAGTGLRALSLALGQEIQTGHWLTRGANLLLPLIATIALVEVHRGRSQEPEARSHENDALTPALSHATASGRRERGRISRRIAAGALAVAILGLGFALQIRASRHDPQAFTLDGDRWAALQWLQKNTPRDSAVLSADLGLSVLIPVYTHDLVTAVVADSTYAPQEEVLRRYGVAAAVYRLRRPVLDRLLSGEAENQMVREGEYPEVRWTGLESLYHGGAVQRQPRLRFSLPEAERRRVLALWEKMEREPVEQALGRFRVDYLWYGPTEREWGQRDPGTLPGVREVFRQGEVVIYQQGARRAPGQVSSAKCPVPGAS